MPGVPNLPVDDPGLAFLCRLCLKMARARDNGSESCGQSGCGGPSAGKAFPLYEGPLATVIENYCYLCGSESYKVISIDGTGRLGMCEKCLRNVFGIRNTSEDT